MPSLSGGLRRHDDVVNDVTRCVLQGRAIKMGDKEVEYHPSFKLILQTKLANPHYQPEMQAQTTLINFTVTRWVFSTLTHTLPLPHSLSNHLSLSTPLSALPPHYQPKIQAQTILVIFNFQR